MIYTLCSKMNSVRSSYFNLCQQESSVGEVGLEATTTMAVLTAKKTC